MNKVLFKDIATVKNGSTPSTKSKDFYDGDIVWITPKDLSNLQSKYIRKGAKSITKLGYDSCSTSLIPKGSILLSSRAPIGLLAIANIELCTNQGFKNLILNDDLVFNEYLFYWLKTKIDYISSLGTGTTFKEVSKSVIENLEIDLPILTSQKQIAKVLSDLDAKIEVNNKINQELEAMAKLIYDFWFVQFDFPDAKNKPYKSSGGNMEFDEKLKHEVPSGWISNTMADWISNDKSGDWGKDSQQGNYISKVSCIRGADLNGLNGKGEVKSPTRYVLEKNSHKLLEIGDFIIEISGGSPTQSTGRMAFITKETLERFENPLICSNFCKAVTLKEEKALYNFAYEWNRLYDAGVLFGWEGKTSGIKNLLFESFVTNYKVVKPPIELMELFYEKAKPIHAQIQKNLQQNQKLAELRDWLLPMLMNGQVTVSEAERELGMIAEDGVKYGKS